MCMRVFSWKAFFNSALYPKKGEKGENIVQVYCGKTLCTIKGVGSI